MDKNEKPLSHGSAVLLRGRVTAVHASGSVTVETESGYRITGAGSEFELDTASKKKDDGASKKDDKKKGQGAGKKKEAANAVSAAGPATA